MVEDTFAFIIHPINIKTDVSRKWPLVGKVLTEGQINFFSRFFPPVYISEITGVTSRQTGRDCRGWFIACPYTPVTMLKLPEREVYKKLVACGKMAEDLGARVMGLGAFTSVVGDAGETIASRLELPVTTGDSYTVYISVQAVREAAEIMGIKFSDASVAVVGATGAIGAACAQMFAREVGTLTLVGRRAEAVEQIKEKCSGQHAKIIASTDVNTIYGADVVVAVTSATHAVIEPKHLKPGAVVLDVARPRDVSRRVEEERNDVLVIEGGMVEVPGPVDFHFNFGFPQGKAFACMAETMVLALEGRYEDFTIGRDLKLEKIQEIGEIAGRHGFKLSGFRSFERAVTEEHIAEVRERASRNLPRWSPLTP
jgi:fatty aldehyde-generating acyl-ACP reductase